MAPLRTHYDNLKVSRDAPDDVIKAAYRALAKKYHPDSAGHDPDARRKMQIINAAYEVLSDEEKRRAHDAWIASMEHPTPPPGRPHPARATPADRPSTMRRPAPPPPTARVRQTRVPKVVVAKTDYCPVCGKSLGLFERLFHAGRCPGQ